MKTHFEFNDGGRSKYFNGKGGDCVTRAIAIVTGKDYKEVYDHLAEGNASQRKGKREGSNAGKRTALRGINTKRKWFQDLMKSWGFEWTPTMKIGEGCKTHLCSSELPKGKLVVAVSKHYTTMIDGVINDTYNPSRIYSSPYSGEEIKTNQFVTEQNNMIHTETRCVYGYWKYLGL
jgi:hypothetical protein